MLTRAEIQTKLSAAVSSYWSTRDLQQQAQGGDGPKDAGLRSAVTGGNHLNGFCNLVAEILKSSGLDDSEVFTGRTRAVLPGYYRPNKDWDVVAVAKDQNGKKELVACIEIKSHAGPSFSNNFNNRVEEALGNSVDFWKAYERALLPVHPRPFLGYILLLEEAPKSLCPTNTKAPHFPVDPVLLNASYADRYKTMCDRLVRERMYHATVFILASRETGMLGQFVEPLESSTFWSFASALSAHALAFSNERSGKLG